MSHLCKSQEKVPFKFGIHHSKPQRYLAGLSGALGDAVEVCCNITIILNLADDIRKMKNSLLLRR
ncbi:hypothetical protein N7530_010693 [Penicillium desertorum]|uniref:Uncharacterized protein n=1 Tax=Penicillium desertorum TaxID=1303715 RepID=A0A9X0BHZ2_9EURO|nr:hypothetical protein N7530_010693 [Penicillium desertorum]